MKVRLVLAAALAAVAWFVVPSIGAWAQSDASCVTDCDDRFEACSATAKADLVTCLATARTPREKADCTNAFLADRHTCRADEKACLAGCAD